MRRSPVRPRALVHRGRVPCAGLVIADRRGARARVLARWTPTATVARVQGAWIVRDGAEAALVRVESLPGDALVAATVAGGALLTTTALSASELAELMAQGARPGDIVRVVAGEAVVDRVTDADAEDLAAWIDVGAVDVVAVTSLGEPPVAVVVVEDGPSTARGVLKGVTAASGAAFAKALASARDTLVRGGGEAAAPLSAGVAKVVGALATAVAWMQQKLRPGEDQLPARTDAPPPVQRPIPSGPPPGPSMLEEFLRWLAERLDRAMAKLTLSSLIGERYSQYLNDMIDAFERGDLMEALRKAIPLGGAGDGTHGPLRLPSPRAKLDITHQKAGGSVALAPGLYERLKALYVRAADRLEAEGRFEEAAFVLAELLNDPLAAVSLLERNGLLERAAELAEAAKLAPEVIVRQWLVAGRRERAVAHARRTRSFDVVVPKLEASDPALGLSLREEWASLLAASGDLARAVEVAWAAPSLRPLADAWIDALLALGGPASARMLARSLGLHPERLDAVLAAFEALGEDRTPDGSRALVAFADALLAQPRGGATAAMARTAARALIARSASGHVAGGHARVDKLVTHAGDGALRADLPTWPEAVRPALATLAPMVAMTVAAADVGAHPVEDAALLPDGRMCLAMGEAGVWIVGRDGRVFARVDAPARTLVMSDHGDRCLAVIARGEAMRVTRVDLAGRRAALWGDVRVDAWADTFDGEVWFVTAGEEVLQLDLLAARPRALQRMLRLQQGAVARSLHRTPTLLAFMTRGASPEVWHYELPRWTLRARKGAAMPDAACVGLDAAGTRAGITLTSRRELRLYDPVMRGTEVTVLDGATPLRTEMSAAWGAYAQATRDGVVVTLFDRTALRPRWEATLHGAARVKVRLTEEYVVVCDDRGRVLAVDLRHGDLARDLRVGGGRS